MLKIPVKLVAQIMYQRKIGIVMAGVETSTTTRSYFSERNGVSFPERYPVSERHLF